MFIDMLIENAVIETWESARLIDQSTAVHKTRFVQTRFAANRLTLDKNTLTEVHITIYKCMFISAD